MARLKRTSVKYNVYVNIDVYPKKDYIVYMYVYYNEYVCMRSEPRNETLNTVKMLDKTDLNSIFMILSYTDIIGGTRTRNFMYAKLYLF